MIIDILCFSAYREFNNHKHNDCVKLCEKMINGQFYQKLSEGERWVVHHIKALSHIQLDQLFCGVLELITADELKKIYMNGEELSKAIMFDSLKDVSILNGMKDSEVMEYCQNVFDMRGDMSRNYLNKKVFLVMKYLRIKNSEKNSKPIIMNTYTKINQIISKFVDVMM